MLKPIVVINSSAANWCNEGHTMCYHVYVTMQHVKDLQLSVVRVGHHVPLAGFCQALHSLHVLNRGVNMMQSFNESYVSFLLPACFLGKTCSVMLVRVEPLDMNLYLPLLALDWCECYAT